jgi:hypothetical protein
MNERTVIQGFYNKGNQETQNETAIKENQVIEVENKQIGYTLIQKLIEMQIEEFKMELIPLSMIIKEKVV